MIWRRPVLKILVYPQVHSGFSAPGAASGYPLASDFEYVPQRSFNQTTQSRSLNTLTARARLSA